MDKLSYLIDCFRELADIFDKHNIHFCLIYGALLGMVREGKLIGFDHDIDIGIWETEVQKIHKNLNEFHKHGFTVHFSESGHVSFHRGKEHVSAMVFKRKGSIAYRTTFTHMRSHNRNDLMKITQVFKYLRWILLKPQYVGDSPKFISSTLQSKLLYISNSMPSIIRKYVRTIVEIMLKIGCNFFIEEMPSKYLDELETINFYNIPVKVPKDRIEYLKMKYGNDWEIPNRNYVYYRDSKTERIGKVTNEI